jgi:glycine hydroxymethyltransferase
MDPEATGILESECRRQQATLNLIASENHASPAVRRASASVFADKYAEGYPDRRYYRGCEQADRAEQLAIDRAKALFAAEHANVQPHSGTTANLAVYMAALEPGDTIMGMDLAHGGHLSHGRKVNFSGRYFNVVSYAVREGDERIDMDAVADLARRARPKIIIAGASAYPRIIDFAAFARIADEVGALLLADIAHIAGLVAGGVHPSPIPHAAFVTTTTHKTLRGPRGAIILCKRDWAKRIDSAVFPGMQGGPFVHEILAKAVALREAAGPGFAAYAAQIVANAKALAAALLDGGWRLVTGGTDNHLLLVDLRSRDEGLTGNAASAWLAEAGIVANMNKIPFDPRPAYEASGVRLGTPAVTTRGLKEPQMRQLGEWIDQILRSRGSDDLLARIRGQVEDLCAQFPIPGNGA